MINRFNKRTQLIFFCFYVIVHCNILKQVSSIFDGVQINSKLIHEILFGQRILQYIHSYIKFKNEALAFFYTLKRLNVYKTCFKIITFQIKRITYIS